MHYFIPKCSTILATVDLFLQQEVPVKPLSGQLLKCLLCRCLDSEWDINNNLLSVILYIYIYITFTDLCKKSVTQKIIGQSSSL